MREKREPGYRPPPKEVYFSYPEGGKLHGQIPLDGEICRDLDYGDWIYRKCIQLVISDSERMLRFTYYRKRKGGKWTFAGQTALLAEVEVVQDMLKEASQRGWIKL
jgi:hypothetical protein